MYDVTSSKSFENINNWTSTVEYNTNNPDVIKILVANKIDLTDEREVTI